MTDIFVSLRKLLSGRNYGIDLLDTTIEFDENFSLRDTICQALGQTSIDIINQKIFTKQQLIQEIVEKLSYTGDDTSGPILDTNKKKNVQDLIGKYCSDLDAWIDENDFVLSFFIEDGHPFYPVFWEYAFYIESEKRKLCRILIGCSSD